MLDQILIAVLSVLVVVLSLSILLRWRKTKGAILLDEKAINGLISAVVENAKAGKIPDIAGRVSIILRDNLKCAKIAFFRLTNFKFETSHSSGVDESELEKISIHLTPDLQNFLKSISQVADLSNLESFLLQDNMKMLKAMGFNYFFSVFLRNSLFGIYFIKTSLSPSNASLKFLTTALAFSLSAAYHIRQQEKRLKKYEHQLKRLPDMSFSGGSEGVIARRDLNRYLKIRNSQELISELTKVLHKECDFDRMVFYIRSPNGINSHLFINWQVKDNVNNSLVHKFDSILEKINPGEVVERGRLGNLSSEFENSEKNKSGDGISHFISIPWADNEKALFGWKESNLPSKTSDQIQDFWRNAMPLVESISRFEKAEEMSYTDGLTGVYNHRYFKKRLTEEFQRAARYGRSLALLILDVDELKLINDSLGHQVGDKLLKALAEVLTESIRSIDLISRYGGDEFCLILPETGRNRARLFMNRIRSRIAANPLNINEITKQQQYSVSIGGAVFPVDAGSVEELIKAADNALLQAKSEGRNCSRLYEPDYNIKTADGI